MKKKFLLLLPLIITACGSSSEVKSDARKVADFPKYGNYCGLDRPKDKEMPTATDEVDTACKEHDKCYEAKGFSNASCDTALITELKNISPKTDSEKVARKSIISYFRNNPQKELMAIDFDKMKD